MGNKKQIKILKEAIEKEGGFNIEATVTRNGHVAYNFNFKMMDLIMELDAPMIASGTPKRAIEGRLARGNIRTHMRHHSRPKKKKQQ
tara:strand:+ start:3408 stop:3668 length:261 start_codon:yes stop_codon:yes gene_type:complete